MNTPLKTLQKNFFLLNDRDALLRVNWPRFVRVLRRLKDMRAKHERHT